MSREVTPLRPQSPRFVDQSEQVPCDRVDQRAGRSQLAMRSHWVAVVAAAVALVLLLVVARHQSDSGIETSTAPKPSVTEVPDDPSRNGTTSSSQPTIMPAVTAVVTGRAGGTPPCDAASAVGRYGAIVSHPERAPLIAESTFADLRWAICGASPVFSDAILNLRSDDNGATWSVNDTGVGLVRSHAGDLVEITFIDATSAEMHVVSPVAERDERYETLDGGHAWE